MSLKKLINDAIVLYPRFSPIISKKRTFESLDIWLKDIKKNTEFDMPIFIIGNNYDKEK